MEVPAQDLQVAVPAQAVLQTEEVIPEITKDPVQVAHTYHILPLKVLLIVRLQNQVAMLEEDTTLEDTGTLQSMIKQVML